MNATYQGQPPTPGRRWLAVVAVVLVAGCAPPSATDPGARVTSGVELPDGARVRQVGPVEAGTVVVLRVGDQLRVTPDPGTSARPWRLTDYPAELLRPQTPPVGGSYLFTAVAVGEGPLVLTLGAAPAPGPYRLRIRILRATGKR